MRTRRLAALVVFALALVATASVRAQHRDISDLFEDAGAPAEAAPAEAAPVEAAPVEDGSGEQATGEDGGALEGPDAGAAAAAETDTADEPPPGEPAVPDEPPSLPEGHVPEITVRLSPEDGLATGDVVHYELTVVVPEGDDVNLPRQEYAPLELVGQDHAESVAGGRRRFVYTLDLLALAPGDLTIPALTVRVITADGVVGTVRTEPQVVHVASLVANEPDAQPRPPTEPVVVMQDDFTLAYIAGALGLMLLGGLIAWLFLRWWRARPKELPPPPPPRPAYEVALEKLRSLRRELAGAVADGTQPRIVDGASDALREYLGHRFGFNGLESTTDEVISRMRHQRLAGTTLTEITTLLGECDLVKFAKAVPEQGDCERVIGEAERIVQRTMHGPVSAIAPPAPAASPTLKEPKLVDPASAPRPEPLGVPQPQPPAPEARPPEARPPEARPPETVAEATAATVSEEAPAAALAETVRAPSEDDVAPTRDTGPIATPAVARIPLTNPPPPIEARTIESPPSFAIPETPVPPPAPRESEPSLAAPSAAELLAKANEALEKASAAAASTLADAPGAKTAILGGLAPPPTTAQPAAIGAGPAMLREEAVWEALDEAVAEDRLVVGEVIARREEGFLVGLGAGVHGVLPEAQLGGLDADAIVGDKRAFRVVSLNAGRKRVVLSHRDVDAGAERALLDRPTPIGFSDPSGTGGHR